MTRRFLPKTLQEAIRYFSDELVCIQFVAKMRWGKAVTCPRCKGRNATFMASRSLWNCKGCRKQFSVKVGTIFEDSAVPLNKWLCAIWMIVNAKNGVSSYEIARSLGVTQKTGWFMMHRIRLALQRGSLIKKLKGDIEADESYIGGSARNMHLKDRKPTRLRKAIVLGMLERNGKVRAQIIEGAFQADMQHIIRQNVAKGATLHTDEHASYRGLAEDYTHKVINHARAYVQGTVHTNGIENFWSLLKRGIRGTYVSVEPFHLFRYLDEQTFRFNTRKDTDKDRFLLAVSTVKDRRIQYQQLIGQTSQPTAS